MGIGVSQVPFNVAEVPLPTRRTFITTAGNALRGTMSRCGHQRWMTHKSRQPPRLVPGGQAREGAAPSFPGKACQRDHDDDADDHLTMEPAGFAAGM
jgi:hypothetical protein